VEEEMGGGGWEGGGMWGGGGGVGEATAKHKNLYKRQILPCAT